MPKRLIVLTREELDPNVSNIFIYPIWPKYLNLVIYLDLNYVLSFTCQVLA